ncbi:restriction endonuclease NspV [Spirochaetia bacterium]|nr:restriction endonuclease NspV [Spirochaetia bacterium]
MNIQYTTKKEYGDFQTPLELANLMINILKSKKVKPEIIVEPTCGTGNILIAACSAFFSCKSIGIEINNEYCNALNKTFKNNLFINIINADIFSSFNFLKNEIVKTSNCLFIGNPPWVTNSGLSTINGTNIPIKENYKELRGIDAITGKSNFDISEYIITKLIENFCSQKAIFAFLCKTIVARNILKYIWDKNIPYKEAEIYPIDSKKYFNAAVDACFFVIDFAQKKSLKECHVFDSIENKNKKNNLGFFQGKIIGDIDKFKSYNYLGKSDYVWRNGIKHDCSKVMELTIEKGMLINGYGETVEIEDDLLFPLLKSSDIANGNIEIRKKVIVSQRYIGEDTILIKSKYPKTWKYLNSHIKDFMNRKSSIYKNKPLFSIFSIGGYSFFPIKIAISGLYKHLSFQLLLPEQNKSIMVDDTCNYIACKTEAEAEIIYALLTSPEAINYLNSIIFWDSKRPITTEILNSINLLKIADKYHFGMQYNALSSYNKSVEKENVMQMALF